nr:hypothetical protein [Okeania sp. SIO2C2]
MGYIGHTLSSIHSPNTQVEGHKLEASREVCIQIAKIDLQSIQSWQTPQDAQIPKTSDKKL